MIRLYTNEDYTALKSWYEARNRGAISADFLPKVGFIVPGVAAGFLMQTDTKSCIIEPFIANPEAPRMERDTALKAIISELIEKARDLGYTQVFGFSSCKTMLDRVKQQGFIFLETNEVVFKEI